MPKNDTEISARVRSVVATVKASGGDIPDETIDLLEKMDRDEITGDQARKEIIDRILGSEKSKPD